MHDGIKHIVADVFALGEPDRIPMYEKYFQCKPDGYGYGDEFLAVRIPALRNVSKQYANLEFEYIESLLQNKVHEIRLLALFIMVIQFKRKTTSKTYKQALLSLYLKNTKYINNWDLVDSSAHYIVGAYCYGNDQQDIIFELSKSNNLWDNRIAMIATFYFIKQEQFDLTFEIAKALVCHKHDLIHKAVGWMLREVGKKNLEAEVEFLAKYYKQMPRTMLRYAIEKFNDALKSDFMLGKV